MITCMLNTLLGMLIELLDMERLLYSQNILDDDSIAALSRLGKDNLLAILDFLLGMSEFDINKYKELVPLLYRTPNVLILASLLALRYGIGTIHALATRLSKLLMHILTNVKDVQNVEFLAKKLSLRVECSDKCLHESLRYIDNRGNVIRMCYRYRIRVSDFLKAAHSLLTEPSWKIISYPIVRGYVYVESIETIIRLLAEHYRHTLIRKLNDVRERYTDYIQSILQLYSTKFSESEIATVLKQLISEYKQRHDIGQKLLTKPYIIDKEMSSAFVPHLETVEDILRLADTAYPPCIKTLINSLISGENLSHHQRFAVASFLVNIGANIDAILNLFKRSPDFNERVARYQIEHIAGLRGSKKKYLPYNCATMRSLGLCAGDCGVKNPLAYYYKRIKESTRKLESRQH